MKKNYMMRLAAVLLVLVLLSTCVISGTFAKYTTKGTATDEAQVAKWGVKVTAPNEESLFAKTYGDTVESSGEYDVVAPGTSGALADFTISGTPEVDVQVTYSAELTLTGWEVLVEGQNKEYMPLVFTVEGDDYYVGKDGITTIAELEAKVEEAIAKVYADYQANAPISDTLEVSWEWAYNTAKVPGQTDALDTALGDAAANGSAATVKLVVTCTVTQVD